MALIFIYIGNMMIKLKNVLKEQEYKAAAIGSLNDSEKKIYQHILNAVAEIIGITSDEVDDITEQPQNRQLYNRQIDSIIKAVEKLANDIEHDGY
jgi:aspartate ammonia-lyase